MLCSAISVDRLGDALGRRHRSREPEVSHPPATDPGPSPEWPELPLSEWEDTRDSLLLWTQVVGKVRMALEPRLNHWWHVALYVSARGLTTSVMHVEGRGLEREFDFVDDHLDLRPTYGKTRQVHPVPLSRS